MGWGSGSARSGFGVLAVMSLVACGGAPQPLGSAGGDNRASGDGRANGDGDTVAVDHPIDDPEKTHSTGGNGWTVLVYMVADNDLEPFAIQDLQEMLAVGPSAKLDFVIQIDRAVGYTSEAVGSLPNFTGTLRVHVDNGKLTLLEDLGEQNMGDPMVLADFIGWGIDAYPADNIALIFWDHGSAWPGFGADMSAGYDGLTMAELSTAMTAGLASARRDHIALVGFDACLMGSLETALVMRDSAEYLLASEELEPGHGWDYRAFEAVRANPAVGPIALAQALTEGFHDQAVDQDTSANITLSLVDLYNLKAVERALASLGDTFNPSSASLVTLFGRARSGALEFGREATVEESALMVDLAGVATTIADAGGPISGAAQDLIDAVDDAVLSTTNGTATAAATGISVYWPPYRTLYDTDYDTVPAISVWRSLLAEVQTGTSSGGAPPKFTSDTATMSNVSGGIRLSGQLEAGTQANVVSEGMYYGLKVDGRYIVLGDTFGRLSGQTVTADWDGAALVVTQGSSVDYSYFSYQPGDNGTYVATIPFGYTTTTASAGLATALLVIVYDASGAMRQKTFYLSTAAGYGQLTPAPGSKLYPVYAELTSGGFVWGATSTFYDATLNLGLSFQGLDTAGANRAAFGVIYASDYAGQEGSASWEGDL